MPSETRAAHRGAHKGVNGSKGIVLLLKSRNPGLRPRVGAGLDELRASSSPGIPIMEKKMN